MHPALAASPWPPHCPPAPLRLRAWQQKPFLPIATAATVMLRAVILVHARRGASWDFLDPSTRRGGGAEPLIPAGEPAWAVFSSCFPPSINDAPSRACRVFLRGASVAPGAAPAGPSRAGPARNRIGSSGAAVVAGRRPGPGTGAWTLPRTGLAAPAAPVPRSSPGPVGLPWPRHPSASRSPKAEPRFPGTGSPARRAWTAGESGVKPT